MEKNNIIKLDSSHYIESLELSCYSFQYKLSEEDIKKRMESMKKQNILGIFDDGKLVSKLSIRPFDIWIDNQKIKMGGIAGVATYPEYRRKGYVKELMKQSLIEMRESGQIISVLHPFSYYFYRKYGWELFSDFSVIHLTKSDLISSENVSGYVKRFSASSYNEYIEDIENIYDKYAQKYIGMLVRERNWWKDTVIKDFHTAIYYNQMNEPLGYLIYNVQNSKMFVKVFIPLNHEARKGMWNFICQHDSMLKELEIWAEVNDPLLFTIINPKVKVEQIAFPMARIVDVSAFLQIYPFNWQGSECQITLNIIDEYAPWNNGTYTVIPGETGNTIVDSSEKEGLTMSINTLSTLMLKYKSASELYEFEQIRGNIYDVRKLDNILPDKKPRFLDAF